MKQSIYEIILENSLPKGELKEEFSLPEEDDNIWVVGAKEGVLSHHAGEGEKGPQMLYEAILTRLDEGWESFQDIIEAYAKAYSTFSIIDDLQSWVIAHKEVLDPNAIYRLGYNCLVKSTAVEGVKLGFALLELFSTSHSEKI